MGSCDLRASVEEWGLAGTGLCCIRSPPLTLADVVEAEPEACTSSSNSPFGWRSHLQKTHHELSYWTQSRCKTPQRNSICRESVCVGSLVPCPILWEFCCSCCCCCRRANFFIWAEKEEHKNTQSFLTSAILNYIEELLRHCYFSIIYIAYYSSFY